jgi:hypothetical protein
MSRITTTTFEASLKLGCSNMISLLPLALFVFQPTLLAGFGVFAEMLTAGFPALP